jgi:hypothetical protein
MSALGFSSPRMASMKFFWCAPDDVPLRLLRPVAAADVPAVALEDQRPLVAVDDDAVRLVLRPLLLPDAVLPEDVQPAAPPGPAGKSKVAICVSGVCWSSS